MVVSDARIPVAPTTADDPNPVVVAFTVRLYVSGMLAFTVPLNVVFPVKTVFAPIVTGSLNVMVVPETAVVLITVEPAESVVIEANAVAPTIPVNVVAPLAFRMTSRPEPLALNVVPNVSVVPENVASEPTSTPSKYDCVTAFTPTPLYKVVPVASVAIDPKPRSSVVPRVSSAPRPTDFVKVVVPADTIESVRLFASKSASNCLLKRIVVPVSVVLAPSVTSSR